MLATSQANNHCKRAHLAKAPHQPPRRFASAKQAVRQGRGWPQGRCASLCLRCRQPRRRKQIQASAGAGAGSRALWCECREGGGGGGRAGSLHTIQLAQLLQEGVSQGV